MTVKIIYAVFAGIGVLSVLGYIRDAWCYYLKYKLDRERRHD
uniref:Uncharacterized protein n=1 Tax=viral metagenome TaxID=1070528 RepID=A0A6M3LI27_9ZZZZ